MRPGKNILLLLIVIGAHHSTFAQTSKGGGRLFDTPVVIDSASTMLIPYRYEFALFASNKAMSWENCFANFIVYDFKNDSYKKLFDQDTYIYVPETRYRDGQPPRYPYISEKWIFYLVKNTDYSLNGKIDDQDPLILFVTDRKGTGLRPLTPAHENVISLTLFESLGFALLKVQRDEDKDREFKSEDRDQYMIRLNLSDLRLGNPIEFRTANPD